MAVVQSTTYVTLIWTVQMNVTYVVHWTVINLDNIFLNIFCMYSAAKALPLYPEDRLQATQITAVVANQQLYTTPWTPSSLALDKLRNH